MGVREHHQLIMEGNRSIANGELIRLPPREQFLFYLEPSGR